MEKTIDTTFGSLLNTFRKQLKITQQNLATHIGVHRNTIGSWERGDYLPESRMLVVEVARYLHLNEQQTKILLESSLIPTTPYWNIPHLRNPFFSGRENILCNLHQVLTQSSPSHPQLYALIGLSGIGKTQLVIEYVYRYWRAYTAVFWISAETYETIASSFLSAAILLELPEKDKQGPDKIFDAVVTWLRKHHQWLLIFDNVEDSEMIRRFLPTTCQGSLLLTTRTRILGSMALSIEVPPMTLDEGTHFLLSHTRPTDLTTSSHRPSTTDFLAAHAIAEAMDGMPLALDQARAYIHETQCSLAIYLSLFEKNSLYLLDRRGMCLEYPSSVVRTLTLVFERLQQQNSAAAELLLLCSFLAPDAIPEELISENISLLGSILESVVADAFQFNIIIEALLNHSLLQRHARTKTLMIHRLVQVVLRGMMDEDMQHCWAEKVVRMIDAALPFRDINEVGNWKRCHRIFPHAFMCCTWIKQWQIISLEAGHMLHLLAGYLYFYHGTYELTILLYLQAPYMRTQVVGADHIDVAETLGDLGNIYLTQNNFAQAISLYQRAIRNYTQMLGTNHPKVAEILHDLGVLFGSLQMYVKAEQNYLQALVIWEQKTDQIPIYLANTLNRLAELYFEQGKYELAEARMLQAHDIFMQIEQPTHPFAASTYCTLGKLLMAQEKDEQAEAFLLQARILYEKNRGLEHPSTALILNEVATLYLKQCRYAEVEELLSSALHIVEKALGKENLNIVPILENYTELLRGTHREEEANSLEVRTQKLKITRSELRILLGASM